jgi:DNA-binding transcriptional LysR family regulator
VDTYFPRAHLIECLRSLQADFSTVAINLRMTTMQGGESLVLEGTCALAVTVMEVPELSPGTLERQYLCEVQMVTVCAPSHPLAAIAGPVPREEFGRHIQLVVTDNQPDSEKTQQGVASGRQWLVNDLGAKHDLLRGGLCWGHMPRHMVAEDIANATLVELQRRAWHMRPLTFMVSQRRGYSFSEYEARLVELLGNPQRFPRDTSQLCVSHEGEKT